MNGLYELDDLLLCEDYDDGFRSDLIALGIEDD